LLPCLPLGCAAGVSDTQSTTPAAANASNVPTPATASAPATPFTQRGVPSGKVILGYLQYLSDPNQCAAVTDKSEKAAEFAKHGEEIARATGAKLVESCPTGGLLGGEWIE
jgi:hypothetical protein